MEGLPEWKRIKPVFDKWNDILENQVTFTLEDSENSVRDCQKRIRMRWGLLLRSMIPEGWMTGWMLGMGRGQRMRMPTTVKIMVSSTIGERMPS